MSECLAEDRDIARTFPTAIYVSPKFPEEPPIVYRPRGKVKSPRKSTSRSKVVAQLRAQIGTTIFRLLVTAQSEDQFSELRKELFPQFVDLSRTISALIPIPPGDRSDVVETVFGELAKQFTMDSWLLPRLRDGQDEAQFCLETLHRAHLLAEDVRASLEKGTLPPESRESYCASIASEWWSILHLRCMVFAMRHKIGPTDDVLLCLMKGFRHSVLSYAHAREAMEPRYRRDYDIVDFSTLTPSDGDYAPDQNVTGV